MTGWGIAADNLPATRPSSHASLPKAHEATTQQLEYNVPDIALNKSNCWNPLRDVRDLGIDGVKSGKTDTEAAGVLL
jgi:hypothetical protein